MLILVAISVIAAGMFIGGAAIGPAISGDGGGGGVFPVFDILSGGGGDGGPALELSANRTQLTVGETVTFTVLGPDGEPARNATVGFGGNTYRVDEDGEVEVRADRVGQLTADASLAGTNGSEIRSSDVEVAVGPRSVQLGVRANRSTATVGEPIALTLVREDTGGAVRGRLDAALFLEPDSWLERLPAERLSGKNGTRLVVVPERPGTLVVVGNRSTSGGERFRPGVRRVPVERRTVPLELELAAESIRVDESVTATVRRADTGERIAATIETGNGTVETGADGEAELRFDAAGERTLTAQAPMTPTTRFAAGVEKLAVRRIPVDLALAIDRNPITDHGEITATVTRADSGAPIEGSVSVAGAAYETGPDGSVEFAVDAVGDLTVRATSPNTSRETYRAATQSLTVTDATIDLDLVDAPDTVGPGEEVAITVRAQNEGPAAGRDTLLLRDGGGATVAETVVALDAGNATTVTLTATAPETPGNARYEVVGSDARLALTVEVQEENGDA